MITLRSRLCYEPQELQFGTSGRRGQVAHLTQLEIYINALGELRYLQALPPAEGGIAGGGEFYFGYDLRPSSTRYVPEQQGRGEIAQAIEAAIRHSGLRPVNLGPIPTPALAHYALGRGGGCIMVTGSHVPFDRNGYKTYTGRGELLKQHERPIGEAVGRIRSELYGQQYQESLFDEWGFFKEGSRGLPPEREAGRAAYSQRYAGFFAGQSLAGMRLVVYQHSAVGRDLLVEVLRLFGAEAIPAGRAESFVPIDTENIDPATMATIQGLADAAGGADAVVSTDGDSDRPLICGVDPAGKARFFGGDLVGMIVAGYLRADAVVVPISCNDAIDRSDLAPISEPKTRIGSPHVIAGMERARRRGKRAVCGWEANGGFLTGSDIARNSATLSALPTRDAMLPILCTLFAAREKGLSLTELFGRLPRRFGRAGLLRRFPREAALAIIARFSGNDAGSRIEGIFTPELGFGAAAGVDLTDGLRITFTNGDVAHVRPSGNADELRIYATADTQERADFIVAEGIAEPDGILRRMEREAASS